MTEMTCWKIRMKLRGPLLTTSSAPVGFGIDAPFARNAAGEYYLAGSLVKGRLKESWQELAEAEESSEWQWARWLGKEPPAQGSEDWESERGLLQFTDFVYQAAGSSALDEKAITYRIERDRETRAVQSGQNLLIETPFAAGGEYWFEGRAWGVVTKEEAAALDQCLRQGLCFTPALGAETTVGFGVITAVDVSRVSEWAQGSGWEATDGERWKIALAPEGPLCLAGRRLAANIFESEPEIAGGAIKGALAALIGRIQGAGKGDVSTLAHGGANRELCEEFSNLRILHAKAVKKGQHQRPGVVPLSAVKTGKDGVLMDVALATDLRPKEGHAPAFQVDWKSSEDAETQFNVVHPPRELRVRTQIDTEQRRAKDENLFAYRMVAPREKGPDGSVCEYEWLSEVGFEGISAAKRPLVQRQLAELLRRYGLPGVGKLKTRCVVHRVRGEPEAASTADKKDGDLWIVTLQTPALLCEIGEIGPGLSDALPVYGGYWRTASGGALELVRLFAAQSLAGGGYLWKQFMRRPLYRPYVLTRAGSTFVLRRASGPQNGNAWRCVEGWMQHGLPVAKTVREAFGLKGDASDWQRCPYTPENGFGEIAVNQAWHWEKAI
jgi:hypothetical protein